MGYHADTSLGRGLESDENEVTPPREPMVGVKYYLMTGREFPFCRRHYRISIQLARPSTAENWVQGSLKVNLYGDAGIIHDLDLTNTGSAKLEHGTTHSIVVTHPADLGGKIRKVSTFIGKLEKPYVHWQFNYDI